MPQCEVVSWIDPGGVELVLTQDVDLILERGVSGRGMPPIRFADEVVPLQPGTRKRSVEHDARDIGVPVAVQGSTLVEVRESLNGLMRRLDPVRGDGLLRVLTADGRHRQVRASYIGGAEVVEDVGQRIETPVAAVQRIALVFRAFDPYWYDVEPFSATYSVLSGPDSTFLPIPNVTTGSFVTIVESEVFTSGTITLTTDVDAQSWPIWTVTGPGSDIALTNVTTGDTIDLSANGGLVLLAGETLIIDTRPGYKTVRDGLGNNLMSYATVASKLWPLGPEQVVDIAVSGADLDTQVQLDVHPAHLTV